MWMDEDYAKHARDEIARWESEGPGFIAQVGDVVLWPAQKAAEVLIPESVQEAVAKAIETFLNSLDSTARALIDSEEVRGRVAKLRETVGDGMESADQAAKHYWNWHVGYGAATGGAT